MLRKIKAQSTLEYIIILTAIVVAVIAGAVAINNQKTSTPTQGLGKLMYQVGQGIRGASGAAKTAIDK